MFSQIYNLLLSSSDVAGLCVLWLIAIVIALLCFFRAWIDPINRTANMTILVAWIILLTLLAIEDGFKDVDWQFGVPVIAIIGGFFYWFYALFFR